MWSDSPDPDDPIVVGATGPASLADIGGKASHIPGVSEVLEEDIAASEIRSRTVRFVEHHKGELPLVVLARVGRVWDLYKPAYNVSIGELEQRPRVWSWIALVIYAALLPLAAAGAFVLRRRRTAVAPLVAMPVMVTITAAAFWGDPRFRRPAEIAIVVLAAVAIDAFATRRPGRSPSADDRAQ